MPLISVLRDIMAIRHHIFYDISAYVMVPVRRDGTGSSWGAARRQALLQPHHSVTTVVTWFGALSWHWQTWLGIALQRQVAFHWLRVSELSGSTRVTGRSPGVDRLPLALSECLARAAVSDCSWAAGWDSFKFPKAKNRSRAGNGKSCLHNCTL